MKKRDKLVVVFGVLLIFLVNFILADITFGNLSYDIKTDYNSGDFISGWINISLDRESSESLIKGFDNETLLRDFLFANDFDCEYDEECSCTPSSCTPRYLTSGNEQTSLTKLVRFLEQEIIGVQLDGDISSIKNFSFEVSTGQVSSCLRPLVIDFLDDRELDFIPRDTVDEICSIEEPYGCFNISDVTDSTPVGVTPMCEEINLPHAAGYRIGAKLIGSGTAYFIMTLNVGGVSSSECNLDISSGGSHYCIVNSSSEFSGGLAEVCVSAVDETNAGIYEINYEDNETCGYVGDYSNDNLHDFEIFAYPLKYKGVTRFVFDGNLFEEERNLSQMIMNYIDEKFSGNCDHCIIPIRLNVGADQEVTVSKLDLGYYVGGLLQDPITNFYDIDKTPSLISSDFLKLDLGAAKIKVPEEITNPILTLEIGDETIRTNISIKSFPKITNVEPKSPSVLVPYLYFLSFDQDISNGSYSFTWDFGDNSSLRTTTNSLVEHTYSQMGTYKLSVKISNLFGERSKNFTISVGDPYDAINETLERYNKHLKNVSDRLKFLPVWVQDEIEESEEIENIKGTVSKIEQDYKLLFRSETEDLVKLMRELVNLNIPYRIGSDLTINPSMFVQGEERFDMSVISDFASMNYEEGIDKKYYDAINSWIQMNMNITYESKNYFSHYLNGENKFLFSEVKMTFTPKRDIRDFFIIIEGDNTQIKFKEGENYGEKDITSGYGITLSGLSSVESTTIEFLHPEEVSFLGLPVYVSPEFRYLELEEEIGPCNSNGKCESGENVDNCRSDCKPWGMALLLLGILILIALIVYIVLQEWYKRNYEKHLFKNKNQLFNLITFMSNCSRQGMKKEDIFNRLKALGWNKEQLEYAWRKLMGLRTGMWEIPVFVIFERKKVKAEIAKRKGLNVNQISLHGQVKGFVRK